MVTYHFWPPVKIGAKPKTMFGDGTLMMSTLILRQKSNRTYGGGDSECSGRPIFLLLLFYFILFHFILFYFILFYFISFYFILC